VFLFQVFSKLKEGRFPGEIELRDLISKTLTRPSILTGSSYWSSSIRR